MKKAGELHNKAMQLAEMAALARRIHTDLGSSKDLFRQALELEKEAAELFAKSSGAEPTRSILYRSAAALALETGEIQLATQLAGKGLAGSPPLTLIEELAVVIEKATFRRHLAIEGLELNESEFYVSVTGPSVDHGMAGTEDVVPRVMAVENLVFRTAERIGGKNFRERGAVANTVKDNYRLYLSAPVSGSFGISFRLGQSQQVDLPGMGLANKVIDEVMEGIQKVVSGNTKSLEKQIPNDSYRRNFVALVRNIAPDGERIKTVNFVVKRRDEERSVTIAPNEKQEFTFPEIPKKTKRERIQVVGLLRAADHTVQDKSVIRIVTDDNKKIRIHVPEGLMNDVVRPYWDQNVKVVAWKEGKEIEMISIDPA